MGFLTRWLLIIDQHSVVPRVCYTEWYKANFFSTIPTIIKRVVQTVKQGLRQMQEPGSIQGKLSKLLFKYRITPHSTTGVAPSELLMGRRLIT